MLDLARRLLSDPVDAAPIEGVEAWAARHREATRGAESSIARAALGGLAADRLAYAFASGFQSALHALVPSLPDGARVAFCATEEGGAHPRAIATRLAPAEGGGFALDGTKRWGTMAVFADELFVIASIGREGDKNQLRLAKVSATADGVTRTEMPPPPFCPEILHAHVVFNGVRVADADVFPGDAYTQFLKPFRTVEDEHVTAAVVGHVVGCTRRYGLARELAERGVALLTALDAAATAPPLSPVLHLVLAGLAPAVAALVDDAAHALASAGPAAEAAASRFRRDVPLLSIASTARAKRTERAWEAVASRQM